MVDRSRSHFLRLKNHHQFSAWRGVCVSARARAQHNVYKRTELARSVIVIQNTQKRLVPHTAHLNDLLHQSFDKSKHIIDKMRPKIRIQLTGEYFKWKTKRAVTMVRMPLDMANYKITNDGIVHYKHVSLHPTPLSNRCHTFTRTCSRLRIWRALAANAKIITFGQLCNGSDIRSTATAAAAPIGINALLGNYRKCISMQPTTVSARQNRSKHS